ncbi:MAG: prepilin-type N-terminal cleavage/methylation domain-containing protein [Deltaproteobacteria bacterium]|nr:prepilin-type N-terminal cleavage/methylation domain-containing protein [Deltaproteobacteria bacterium]MBW2414190.1 prepilin-type N-terminal cleavage/methylation domain-containing protein [Deltaproteobacteria bacterium]
MRNARRSEGFTLMELMVAMAVMGIITAQLMLVFTSQRRATTVNDRVLDVQESARVVINLISYDARMAGLMVPRRSGVASVDGGFADPDRICISDSSYFSMPLDGTKSPSLDNRDSHFDTSEVTEVQVGYVRLETTDIDGDGAAIDFSTGGGIIVSNGNRSHCAEIQTIVGDRIDFVAGHEMPAGLFPVAAEIRAVPAIVYEVDTDTLTLTRNGITLATSVEDLQIEYWVDAQIEDGRIAGTEFPIHDLNADPGGWVINTELIRRMRFSVTSRTDAGDQQDGMMFNRFARPASANRDPGGPDEFRRRRFSASVAPRNMF